MGFRWKQSKTGLCSWGCIRPCPLPVVCLLPGKLWGEQSLFAPHVLTTMMPCLCISGKTELRMEFPQLWTKIHLPYPFLSCFFLNWFILSLLPFFLLNLLCIYLCMLHMDICLHVCWCMGVLRSVEFKDWYLVFSLVALHLMYWGRVSNMWSEITDLSSQASQLASWFCLSPSPECMDYRPPCLISIYIGAYLYWSKLCFSCFWNKCWTHWTISQPPKVF